MRGKTAPLVILIAAVAALALSAVWAIGRANDDNGWTMSRYGPGMMGYAPGRGGGDPVRSTAEARRQAQRFADRLDLRVGEVIRFTNQYYAALKEKSGRLATEVLVDPQTGAVWLEYGPAMMWNTRYGMMSDFRARGGYGGMMQGGMMGGGMMGGGTSPSGMMGGPGMDPTWTPGPGVARTRDVSAAEAVGIANRWLKRADRTLSVEKADAFPGYFTLEVLRDGKVAGMMSVNAATGSVWYHWWHGRFVSIEEG